jgi:hypothetical protein
MISARISFALPSTSLKRIFGVSVVRSRTSVSDTEKWTSPPSRSRAAARSTNTSFWGYSQTASPTRSVKSIR